MTSRNSMTFQGVGRGKALFTGESSGALLNLENLTVDLLDLSQAEEQTYLGIWDAQKNIPPATLLLWDEIVCGAVHAAKNSKTMSLTAAGKRAYTIPRKVAENARRAAPREFNSELTEVSKHIRALLATGGQINLTDVLYVSRFFNANTQATAGFHKWNAWGGDDARIWSIQLSDRLNYDSVVADAGTHAFEPDLAAFWDGEVDTRAFYAEKVATEGDEVVALFTKSPQGTWLAWGNGEWLDCDEPDAASDNRFVELDDDTALYLAAALYDAPDTSISLRACNPAEWDVAESSLAYLDWDMLDRVSSKTTLRAAGEEYTPEERSKNASGQLRDANGRFAKVGDTGRMKSTGLSAEITNVDATAGVMIVKASDGNSYSIPADDFEVGASATTQPGEGSGIVQKIDFDGILAQPRAVKSTPQAWLKNVLPPMDAPAIKKVIDDYAAFINDERQKRSRDFETKTGTSYFADDTPADETSPSGEKLNPDSSDIPPLHLAIVDKDDPRAVLDLVALIPAGPTDSTPTTFRRVGGEWVEAPDMLTALRSATPPPTVQLDDANYADVLAQIDSEKPDAPEDAHTSEDTENPHEPTPTEAANYEKPPSTTTPEGPIKANKKKMFEKPVTTPEKLIPTPPLTPALKAGGECEEGDPSCEIVYVLNSSGEITGLFAAGGADRNKGNAETLRRYWTTGEGGVKIGWGRPGDWRSCVRHLSKHLGPRAKGYCALRHKEMTGMWPGDRRNRKEFSLAPGAETLHSHSFLRNTTQVLRASAEEAATKAALMKVYGGGFAPTVPTAADITEGRSGRAFKIPLLLPEGMTTGDGRTFGKGSVGMRTLPLPLLWQITTADGHDGSPIVGRIDHIERISNGLGNAYGVFDTGPYGQEAQRLVENKMLRWVSADLDKFEIDEAKSDPDNNKMFIKKGRVMGATLVAKPAFQEVTIDLLPLEEEPMPLQPTESAITASASIAKSIPVEPPLVWFQRPILNGPSPITVTDEGQVFGHIATWTRDHIGYGHSVNPPRSASNYAYFATGVLRTNEGKDVKVGQLTLAGGHAGDTLSASKAVQHYDDTGSAVADVTAGEDTYGIWVAGALRPGTTPEQIRALRASAPSGDWRRIEGRLELVAVCQVNVPGFPVPRAMVASAAGVSNGSRVLESLVAAGSSVLLEMRRQELAQDEESLLAAARERVYNSLNVEGYMTEFKSFSEEKIAELAESGAAMKDGSFPIENGADLRRAILAYGKGEFNNGGGIRRHIVRRARALSKIDMIPGDWRELNLSDERLTHKDRFESLIASLQEQKVEDLKARIGR